MINRTFLFWTLPPMKREVAFSVVVYDYYQYLHQAASHFMGGGEYSQIYLFLVLSRYCGWQATARSCICFGPSSHFVAEIYTHHYVIIPIGYVLMHWIGGSILSTAHTWFWVPCIESSITMEVWHCSVWIFFSVNDLRWSQQCIRTQRGVLWSQSGNQSSLNCSIHGVLPLCMNG